MITVQQPHATTAQHEADSYTIDKRGYLHIHNHNTTTATYHPNHWAAVEYHKD